jgi:hypothetical protein
LHLEIKLQFFIQLTKCMTNCSLTLSLLLENFFNLNIDNESLFLFLLLSCGPDLTSEMISRRRILSRSRDELNFADQYNPYDEEEDIWYTKDKLFKVSPIRILCYF